MALILRATPSARRSRVTEPFRLFPLAVEPVPRVTSAAETSDVPDRDALLLRSLGATAVSDYRLRVQSLGGVRLSGSYQSSAPSVATVDALGYVRHVAPGTATLTYSAGDQSRSVALGFGATGPATQDTLLGYVPGSLAHHIAIGVDSRLAGKTPEESLRIYTVQNHAAGLYARNAQVWCADWDLTPISPWNSSGGPTRAGCLISPRHLLFAAHYQLDVGARVRFVSLTGEVVERTLAAKRTHPDYQPFYPDITVGVLDSDVPEGIGFARLLPDDWADHLPALSITRPLPALTLDQEEKALVTDWASEGTSTGFRAPSDPHRASFYEPKIGSDSGNPALVRIGDHLVLLTVWTYGGPGSGTSVRAHKAQINTMMTQLGGGYQLTEVDLSAWPSYAA